jgi:hypothetical protein
MKIPQEQRIVDSIAQWLREITWKNGYYTNAGALVFTDECDVPDEPTSDTLLLLDKGARALGRGRWTLTLVIEALVVIVPIDGASTGRTRARELVADIRDALKQGRTKALLPAGATELREVQRDIPVREPGANLMLATTTLEIDYSDIYLET